jgi:hypothetical protein
VIDAAQFHHNYRSDGKNHLAAHLVAASDVLCDYVMPGAVAPTEPASAHPVLMELGLGDAQITGIIEQSKPTIAGLMGIR